MTVHGDALSPVLEAQPEPASEGATVNTGATEQAIELRRQLERLRREQQRTAARDFDD